MSGLCCGWVEGVCVGLTGRKTPSYLLTVLGVNGGRVGGRQLAVLFPFLLLLYGIANFQFSPSFLPPPPPPTHTHTLPFPPTPLHEPLTGVGVSECSFRKGGCPPWQAIWKVSRPAVFWSERNLLLFSGLHNNIDDLVTVRLLSFPSVT